MVPLWGRKKAQGVETVQPGIEKRDVGKKKGPGIESSLQICHHKKKSRERTGNVRCLASNNQSRRKTNVSGKCEGGEDTGVPWAKLAVAERIRGGRTERASSEKGRERSE